MQGQNRQTTTTNINSVIAVMNQRLLNQSRKQGLDIRGLVIFMGLVIARLQYALPAIAGQILVDDIKRVNVLAKAFRWQLTSIVPSAADMVDADKKTIPLCSEHHPLLTSYASTPKHARGITLKTLGMH